MNANEDLVELDDFVEYTKNAAQHVGKDFEDPDDDWMAVAHVLAPARDGSDELELGVVGFDPEFLSSGTKKDAMVEALRKLIRGSRALSVTLVLSAWTAKQERKPGSMLDNYEGLPPAERPDRVEVLLIHGMNATERRMWHAKIERDGQNPPTLAEWEQWPAGDAMGRFIEPVQDALKIVAREEADG